MCTHRLPPIAGLGLLRRAGELPGTFGPLAKRASAAEQARLSATAAGWEREGEGK